jgi:hypothetical protein
MQTGAPARVSVGPVGGARVCDCASVKGIMYRGGLRGGCQSFGGKQCWDRVAALAKQLGFDVAAGWPIVGAVRVIQATRSQVC